MTDQIYVAKRDWPVITFDPAGQTDARYDVIISQCEYSPRDSSLKEALKRCQPFPRKVILLGVAEDGFPVLLNLDDPVPGPILIVADANSGKTAFLQAIAQSIEYTHVPSQIEFGVITNRPAQWANWMPSSYCAGVYSPAQPQADRFVIALDKWMKRKASDQMILLFIDGLEAVRSLGLEACSALWNLFSMGPSRSVWPIVTFDPTYANGLETWLSCFHTQLLGFKGCGIFAATLDRGSQFAMLEGSDWVKFSILR